MKGQIAKEFIHLKRAWYASSALQGREYIDEVYIIVRSDDEDDPELQGCGVTYGEVMMRWYNLDRSNFPSPRLEVFSDGLRAMHTLYDVISKLIETGDEEFTPEEFSETLEGFGFKDITPTTR